MFVKSKKRVTLKCEGKWKVFHEIMAHGCRLLMLIFLSICQHFNFFSYYESPTELLGMSFSLHHSQQKLHYIETV